MPFRRTFSCLWCGRDHTVRSDDDLEGWAALCPECLGKADDNGFLRFRLRAGLRDRAASASASRSARPDEATAVATASPTAHAAASPPGLATASAPGHDDWYLRRGPYARGPLQDGPWAMELDEVTRWLDRQPLGGTVVELAAGTGWWSALLAEKGELWIYDEDGTALDAASRRLLSHGLAAHIHERDPLAPPQAEVDWVVAAFLLGRAESERALTACIGVIRDWLKPAGTFLFIEAAPPSPPAPVDGPAGRLWPRDPAVLRAALTAAGLEVGEVSGTRTAFVTGRATRPT